MGTPKKQKETGNEKFLKEVGRTQFEAAKMFEPAHQSVLTEAQTDQTDLFRGRLAGDVWQQLGATLSTDRLARGDAVRSGGYDAAAKDALNTSLREGTRRGAELRDERIYLGAGSRLSNAKQSNLSIQQAARTAHAESADKARHANDWNNELIGAGVTLASFGIGQMANKPPAAGGGEPISLNYKYNGGTPTDSGIPTIPPELNW